MLQVGCNFSKNVVYLSQSRFIEHPPEKTQIRLTNDLLINVILIAKAFTLSRDTESDYYIA
jgi:hypothetical protein